MGLETKTFMFLPLAVVAVTIFKTLENSVGEEKGCPTLRDASAQSAARRNPNNKAINIFTLSIIVL